MDMGSLIDFVLHLDKHLSVILEYAGLWSYLLFFVVIFAETGLVVTPFLPGDSLVFTLGTLAAVEGSPLQIGWVFVILAAAAILGDSANYAVGKYFGSIILKKQGAWFLKKEHIDRTHRFYEKYGSKTIVLARFVPIVRTFAPFVAGVGRMSYRALPDLQRDRRASVDHALFLRRVFLWQHPHHQEELRARHHRDHHHLDSAGRDRGPEGKKATAGGRLSRRQGMTKRYWSIFRRYG